jgi:hypothetical protein
MVRRRQKSSGTRPNDFCPTFAELCARGEETYSLSVNIRPGRPTGTLETAGLLASIPRADWSMPLEAKGTGCSEGRYLEVARVVARRVEVTHGTVGRATFAAAATGRWKYLWPVPRWA